MTPEQAAALREPFPAELIGQLPKPTKKDNPKGRCKDCGGWHGLPAVHLDYVGHAAVTDRILSVDPDWTWNPMARDPNTGAPILVPNTGGLGDETLGLWGSLTICDVTKPAFGGGKNAKECISDLIRNGAMRFGVGLDLWSKEDLHVADETAGGAETPSQEPDQRGAAATSSAPPPAATDLSLSERAIRFVDNPDLTLAHINRQIPALEDIEQLKAIREAEANRQMRVGKKPRSSVIDLAAKRIKDLEGEPSATTDAPAETSLSPEAAQDSPPPVAAPASPTETEPGEDGLDTRTASPGSTNGEVLRLKAALGWIQDQPSTVDNPQLWTVKDVLWALSQRGGGTYGLIEEIPPEWLEAIWVAIPEGVRSSVELLGPEARADLASKAK